jgi:hypothetical protein
MMKQQQQRILVAICLFGTIINYYMISAQVIGTDICACGPRSYTFRLNFSLTCADTTITNSSATAQPSCTIRGDGREDVDEVPVQIQTIQIVELDQNFRGVAQVIERNAFTDGSTLTYVSIIDQPTAINTTSLPRGIQVVMTGRNANNQTLLNVFVVTFTNDCAVYPAIEEAASIGWAVFVSNYLF